MQLNAPAPEFSLPDLDGRIHRLSDHRGRITILNFWSAECPWVERVDRQLLPLLRSWGTQVDLLAIAANATESDGLLAWSAQERGLPFVLHASPQVLEDYNVEVTPTLCVVAPDGLLSYEGAYDDVTFRQRTPTRSYLREAVTALLEGRLPDPGWTPPYGCTVVRQTPESC